MRRSPNSAPSSHSPAPPLLNPTLRTVNTLDCGNKGRPVDTTPPTPLVKNCDVIFDDVFTIETAICVHLFKDAVEDGNPLLINASEPFALKLGLYEELSQRLKLPTVD
jgi:hypothetical protein